MTIRAPRHTDHYLSYLDAVHQCVSLSLDGMERMLKLQIDAGRELWSAGSRQCLELWSWGDSLDPAADWRKLYDHQLDHAVALTRACMSTASQLDHKLARFVEQKGPALSRSFFDSMLRAGLAPEESPAAPQAQTEGPDLRTRKRAA